MIARLRWDFSRTNLLGISLDIGEAGQALRCWMRLRPGFPRSLQFGWRCIRPLGGDDAFFREIIQEMLVPIGLYT